MHIELVEEVMHEAKLLSTLQHPHVVRFFGVAEKDDVLSIVTEFCPHTLADLWLEGSPIYRFHPDNGNAINESKSTTQVVGSLVNRFATDKSSLKDVFDVDTTDEVCPSGITLKFYVELLRQLAAGLPLQLLL